MQSIQQNTTLSSDSASFSPRPTSTFAHDLSSDQWDNCSSQSTTTLQASSSNMSHFTNEPSSSSIQEGFRPSSASWLDSAFNQLQERDLVKASFLNPSHLCSLSPLNELNPSSPSGASFGPSTTPTPSLLQTSNLKPSSTPFSQEDLNHSTPNSPSTSQIQPNTRSGPAPPTLSSHSAFDKVLPQPAEPLTLDQWDQSSFSLSVAFTGAIYRPQSTEIDAEHDGTAPPAFFPLQRVGFSPQLKVHSRHSPHMAGLPLSLIGGMTLGVTGVVGVPAIDRKAAKQAREPRTNLKKWKTQRVVVDFVTDLSHGLETWKSDAEFATQSSSGYSLHSLDGQAILPPGTYILPLSMKIPASEKLPPSFTCDHFRITYTMSLALWSKATDPLTGQPIHCKVFTVPFEILPATLPTGPPKLPRLVWEDRSLNGSTPWGGMWEGLKRAITLGNTSPNGSLPPPSRKRSIAAVTAQMHGPQATAAAIAASTATHIVIPSLPSASFSPASQASIPVTLSIIDRPIVPTDLYIRISLVRSIYARDSKNDWLTEVSEYLMPEDILWEKHLKEEKEICSRWGYIPYHLRPHANPLEECEILIRDLSMPFLTDAQASWDHGYSTSLELEPSAAPRVDYHPVTGSSWFSPAFRRRPPMEKEYSRHLHVSTRFAIVIEIGFARVPEQSLSTGILQETLQQVKASLGDEFVIPAPHTFTKASVPRFESISGASLTNPFPPQNASSSSFGHRTHQSLPSNNLPIPSTSVGGTKGLSRLQHHRSASCLYPNPPPSFPGKIRTLRCPIVIGSVAEPNLSCLLLPESERRLNRNLASSGEAEDEEERRRREEAEDMRRAIEAAEPSLVGDGDAWICAPPDYVNSLKGPPAYLV
ncbi:hypothetical protein O181_075705 [Austropuccinia psidii MF-1]|uniref:Uncharacterized protein n=1 Tax=Austropuccinia psidii MF-1 TaxID=1389203 RepID=A0A9Q3IEA1_9BASI|nr:hypothetical protein [Austropuccinia psidii MF-1]